MGHEIYPRFPLTVNKHVSIPWGVSLQVVGSKMKDRKLTRKSGREEMFTRGKRAQSDVVTGAHMTQAEPVHDYFKFMGGV